MAVKRKTAKKHSTQAEPVETKPLTRVLVEFIQDRSGSMGGAWTETVNGFKVLVNDLKKNGEKDGIAYYLSLTVFDTLVDQVYIQTPIRAVDTDVLNTYPPRGGTALMDAVGATIKGERPSFDKIICIIVTDGDENSSCHETKESINVLVDERLNSGNWTFQYLGAQPETWKSAESIGIPVAGSTLRYSPSNAGQTYSFMAQSLGNFAASKERGTRNMRTYDVTPTAGVAGLQTVDEDKSAKSGGSGSDNS